MDVYVDIEDTLQDEQSNTTIIRFDLDEEAKKLKQHQQKQDETIKNALHNLIRCPLTTSICLNPVVASDTYVYEDRIIKNVITISGKSPITRIQLEKEPLTIPLLKKIIDSVVKQMPELETECFSESLLYADNVSYIDELINQGKWDELRKYKQYQIENTTGLNSFITRIAQYCNDVDVILYVLENSTDILSVKRYVNYFAFYCKYLDVFKFLKKAGICLTDGDTGGYKPIYYACKSSTLDIVKFLCLEGSGINDLCSNASYPICVCHQNPSMEVKEYIIRETRDDLINSVNGDLSSGTPPLFLMMKNTADVAQLEKLVELMLQKKSIDLTIKDSLGWMFVHHLLNKNLRDIFLRMLPTFIDLEVATKNGWRPIHFACRYCSAEVIDTLISKGVKLDAGVSSGESTSSNILPYNLLEQNTNVDQPTREVFVDLMISIITSNVAAVVGA